MHRRQALDQLHRYKRAKVMPEQVQNASTSNTVITAKNTVDQPTKEILKTEPNDSFCKTRPSRALPYSQVLSRVALWNNDPQHAYAAFYVQNRDHGIELPDSFYDTSRKDHTFSSDVDYFIESLAAISKGKDDAVYYDIPGQIIEHDDVKKTDTVRTGTFSYIVNRYGKLARRCFVECSYNDMAKQTNTGLNPKDIDKKDTATSQPTQKLGNYQENNWYVKIKDTANNRSLILFKLKR